MKITGEYLELEDGIKEISKDMPDLTINVKRCEKGFSLLRRGKECTIEYAAPTDFFRALAIARGCGGDIDLRQINRFDTCGIMIDVSRCAVLKVETIKDIIRYMADMGLNMLMLYTEDTYKIDDLPYFGYMRGAYTKEEIKETVAYASLFGIEVVPCIQTLAHLASALHWNYAADIKDTSDILLVDEEKTYEFIEKMIKTARESYITDKIHIGMDEAHFVGLGRYLQLHGYKDRFEIISRHLRRVLEITSKYGFKPMMWSDMFFSLGSETGNYYDDNVKMPDNISEIIPDEISMVYWDYYNNTTEKYEQMIEGHKQMKRPIVFAGGIWTWQGFSPQYDKTFITTKSGLEACVKQGVKDVFATMWGDDGAECSIYTALYGMQLYAEYNYSETPLEMLDEMFKSCTGFDGEAFRLLSVDTIDDKRANHEAHISKQVLYNDPLQGLFDKNHGAIALKSHFKKILDGYNDIRPQKGLEYLFDFHHMLAEVLYLKCDINNRLLEAYNAHDMTALKELAVDYGQLAEKFKLMHEKVAKIWYRNNKPFGFNVIDARLGGTETRINRAKERIEMYIRGEIPAIEELEEERLGFGEENEPFDGTFYYASIL